MVWSTAGVIASWIDRFDRLKAGRGAEERGVKADLRKCEEKLQFSHRTSEGEGRSEVLALNDTVTSDGCAWEPAWRRGSPRMFANHFLPALPIRNDFVFDMCMICGAVVAVDISCYDREEYACMGNGLLSRTPATDDLSDGDQPKYRRLFGSVGGIRNELRPSEQPIGKPNK